MAQRRANGAPDARPPSGENPDELPVGELLKRATEQTSRLAREELHLAQLELQEKAKHAGLGIGMFGVAGIVALFGAAALVATAILALSTAIDHGWPASLVAGVLLVAAGASRWRASARSPRPRRRCPSARSTASTRTSTRSRQGATDERRRCRQPGGSALRG